MTPKRILVATDFSTAANAAVQRAAVLAHRSGAQLMLLHVMPPKRWLDGLFASRKHWYEQVQSRSNVVLGEQAAKLTAQIGVEIGTALVNGHASAAIRAASEEFEADLVVIGARGERQGQQALDGLGHTATKLLESTNVPLLLVKRNDTATPDRVLMALDLSPASIHVARWGSRIAGKAKLWALHVYEAPFAGRFRSYGVSRQALDIYSAEQQAQRERKLRIVLAKARVAKGIGRVVMRGEATPLIQAQLRKLKIDTLVIGKHTKRKRNDAAPYGSVCHHLACVAPVDVLVVP